MTLTIGRTVLDDPDVVQVSGDDVALTIDLDAASAADMKAKRQQLVGYVGNRDEEIVPVIWSDDSSFDGFYEVKSVTVPSSVRMLDTGYVPPLNVALRRIAGGFSNPRFEVTATNVTRTNSHAIAGSAPLYVPDNTTTYDIDGFSSIALANNRPSADGVTMAVLATGDPNGKSYRFDVAPADYYKAACTVEVDIDGSWWVAVGRQIPRATRFRISNGLVRVTSASSGAGATFEAWNGSAWVSVGLSFFDTAGTAKALGRFTPASFSGSARDIPVTLLRNSPEQVTVRQTTFSDQVTFSLLRGSRHLTIHWSVSNNFTGTTKVGIGLTTGAAGTAITGGVRVNAATSTVSMVFAGAATRSADTGNTRTTNTNVALTDTLFAGFFLTGDTDLNDETRLVQQMMSGVNWRQRVVAR